MHPPSTTEFSQVNQQGHSAIYEVSCLKQRGRIKNKHELAGKLCVGPTTSNKDQQQRKGN